MSWRKAGPFERFSEARPWSLTNFHCAPKLLHWCIFVYKLSAVESLESWNHLRHVDTACSIWRTKNNCGHPGLSKIAIRWRTIFRKPLARFIVWSIITGIQPVVILGYHYFWTAPVYSPCTSIYEELVTPASSWTFTPRRCRVKLMGFMRGKVLHCRLLRGRWKPVDETSGCQPHDRSQVLDISQYISPRFRNKCIAVQDLPLILFGLAAGHLGSRCHVLICSGYHGPPSL